MDRCSCIFCNLCYCSAEEYSILSQKIQCIPHLLFSTYGYIIRLMNRKLASLLLICFSLSILGLAFHYHADGVSHHNCSICSFASLHSNLVFQDAPQISAPSSNVLFILIENTGSISYPYYTPYSNRAPPA